MTARPSPPAVSRVRIITDRGDIVLKLRADRAPRSVAAFLTEIERGTYNGGSFGRIVRVDNDSADPVIEVIQGMSAAGDDLRADVEVEPTSTTALRHLDGTISLPRASGGLSCAQSFFICIGAQPALDSGGGRIPDGLGFSAFGQVVEGMKVVHTIHATPTIKGAPDGPMKGQVPIDPPLIRSMRLDTPLERSPYDVGAERKSDD